MNEPKHPLAEVFGHLASDHSSRAQRYRSHRLCPFNNKVPNCTKDKAKDPLGVCSVFHEGTAVITCPIRFREDWLITDDAASFFFDEDTSWSALTEVRLNDATGRSAGNIDVVLVAYDRNGKVFRKRLAPQLLFKGGILHSWKKKIVVALNKSFFDTLPRLKTARKADADIAWLIYDLQRVKESGREMFKLTKIDEVFTEFQPALLSITTPVPGKIGDFVRLLQEKLDEQLENSPVNRTIEKPF